MRNALLLAPGLLALLATTHASEPVVPTDGMVIRTSVTLKPGVYALPKGLTLEGDDVTLEASGVTLVGDGTGQAVLARGVKNLTIRGLGVQRYRWGIRVIGGSNVGVEGCRVRDTAEETPADGVWLDVWRKADDAYGAAIFLQDVKGGRVADNDIQHQQNGISLYSCSRLTVERNNASFQSGWGIHLYNSSDNVIQDNLADWCDRIHKRGERYYYPGADAAGILMVWNSSRNVIRRNMFRGGGDGVFVAGFHGPGEKVPCDDNLFEDNDCSYSPNNAFESTFCKGNIFRNNRANASNYGFWLGYSNDNVVEGNEVRRNRIAGIAVEHGLRNTYSKNRVSGNAQGIALWSRSGAGFAEAFQDRKASSANVITGNTFQANGVAFISRRDGDDAVANPRNDSFTGNTFYGNGTAVLLLDSTGASLKGNRFERNRAGVRFEGGSGHTVSGNWFVNEAAPAWSDVSAAWTGNYWGDAPAGGFTTAGPAAGKDSEPLKEAPPLPDGNWVTAEEVLRGSPR